MVALLHETEVWVLLGFIIFVVLIWKKAKQALAGGLDARAERIRQQIVEAEKLRAEAEAMLRDAEQRQKAALQETKALLDHATQEAARLKEQASRDIAALLERRKRAAIEKIAQAEASAVAEVRQFAVDVAIAATRQMLTNQVRGPLADRMIDQAIAELPRRLS
ncbi:MAG TPA: hypothetical protein VMB81_24750 [Candidatus Sulfotelmatobacter sp.]|nr:hypothetical protein [Candidatus Sulfotelmatobacter sp.]